MEKERLQKILSSLGVCSRRKGEQLILDGRIKVNDEIVSELGFKCSLEDKIEVDGEIVNDGIIKPKKYVYLAFHKPYDVVSTLSDPQGRKTIVDYIPKEYGRLFPVGRLDHNSTGLMILTNDGEFANLITHPSSSPEKEYLVKVKNPLKGDEISRLAEGLYVLKDAYKAAPCEAKVIRDDEDSVLFDIILHEGKKREIRHMMDTLDHPVKLLMRIRIGDVLLGRLKEGEISEIPQSVIAQMKADCYKRKEENIYHFNDEDELD